ncbi:MAG: proton-conducting transporter membrane subunit [bacterium]
MLIFFMLVVPLVCSALIVTAGENRALRNLYVMIPAVFACLSVIWLINYVLIGGNHYAVTLVDAFPFTLKFNVDPFSLHMAFSMSFLWILTNIYAFGYMAPEHSQTRFFSSLTINVTAAMGICFAENFITFFIFFELLTVAVYPLIIHEETETAYNAGIIYGAYLLAGGAALVAAFGIIFAKTGTVSFIAGGIPGMASLGKGTLILLFCLLTFAFGFKAALVPFQYYWLPDAMIAPTPVTAVLHAVAVVNVGVFGFFRVIYNIFGITLYRAMGFSDALMFIAATTIIVAAIIGMRQKEIKKMMAFSTVNQMSYMLMGAVCLDVIGQIGGLLHIYFHAFMKIALFYSAGCMMTQSKNKYIARVDGLAKRMPITLTCYAVAALGVIGLPPMAGWLSKFYLIRGYLNSHMAGYAFIFIISGVLELGFFAPLGYKAWFKKEQPGAFHFEQDTSRFGSEAPWTMLAPMVIVCIMFVIFGLWGSIPMFLAKPALAGLMGKALVF